MLDYLPATVLEVEKELEKPVYENEDAHDKQDDVRNSVSRARVLLMLNERPVDWHGIIAVAHIALTKEREEE